MKEAGVHSGQIDWDALIGEAKFSYSCSSGPGGQNVNKTNTKVTLRWRPRESRALSLENLERLLHSPLVQQRLNEEGEVLLVSQTTRSQEHNRSEVIAKLRALVGEALKRRKKRVSTRPGRAARERRLAAKRRRGQVKQQRRWGRGEE